MITLASMALGDVDAAFEGELSQHQAHVVRNGAERPFLERASFYMQSDMVVRIRTDADAAPIEAALLSGELRPGWTIWVFSDDSCVVDNGALYWNCDNFGLAHTLLCLPEK